jgi:ribose transport system permease protein
VAVESASIARPLSGWARGAREGARRYLGVLAALILLVIWLSSTQSAFFTSGNILNILEASAALLALSVGATFVMLVGGFDLSIGGMLGLSGVMLATLIQHGTPTGLAIAIVIVGGTLVGLVLNGILIARAGLSFFVVTLATGSLFTGIAEVKTQGNSLGLYTNSLIRGIAVHTVAGVPASVIIAAVVLLTGMAVLHFTGFGRQVFVVGGNREAARLAGISVSGVQIATYAIAAGCAAIAGVLTTGRLASAAPDTGTGMELTAAAAVMIGGTSLFGGSGGLFGTLLGVLFLGVLSNGLTLAGISAFWQGVVTGIVLILAISVDRFVVKSAADRGQPQTSSQRPTPRGGGPR